MNDLDKLRSLAVEYDVTAFNLDDIVHDLKSEEASVINNQGLDAQLEFILTSCGVARAADILNERRKR